MKLRLVASGTSRAGNEGYGLLFLRTMRYSLRRELSVDFVDRGTHNPTSNRAAKLPIARQGVDRDMTGMTCRKMATTSRFVPPN